MKNLSILRKMGLIAVATLGLIGFSATANAQYGQYGNYGRDNRNYDNRGYGYQGAQQVALTNGYQLGYGSGSNDRRYGSSFDIRRSKAYRDADSGYRSEYGSRDAYKDGFRQGFELGYRDAYSGYQRRTFQGYSDYNYNNDRSPYNNHRNNRPYNRNRRYGRNW